MSPMPDPQRNPDDRQFSESLTAASIRLRASASDVRQAMQRIDSASGEPARSVQAHGEQLEALAGLFASASARLGQAADDLAGGADGQAVMQDVLHYTAFLDDQLRSEHREVLQVLQGLVSLPGMRSE